MALLSHGLIQVYTGPGKGKTTAALGLTWRMLGTGGAVYFCQFCKPSSLHTGEASLAHHLVQTLGGRLRLERLDEIWDMHRCDTDAQQANRMHSAIAAKLDEIIQLAAQGHYDLMVLDELAFCLAKNLADQEQVLALLDNRGPHVEIVLTGRDAPSWLIDRADLVSHMKDVKHPFAQDIPARRGIEY